MTLKEFPDFRSSSDFLISNMLRPIMFSLLNLNKSKFTVISISQVPMNHNSLLIHFKLLSFSLVVTFKFQSISPPFHSLYLTTVRSPLICITLITLPKSNIIICTMYLKYWRPCWIKKLPIPRTKHAAAYRCYRPDEQIILTS